MGSLGSSTNLAGGQSVGMSSGGYTYLGPWANCASISMYSQDFFLSRKLLYEVSPHSLSSRVTGFLT